MQRLRWRRSLFAVPVLAALAAFVGGCAPTTNYRYSAFVPAVRPIPWDGQTPRSPGTISVEGSLTGTTVSPDLFPQVGDTAVLVPRWTLEGSAMVAVSSRVQLGVRGAYASYDWSQPSATGTMPVPNAPGSWGLGPEVHATFPLDRSRRFWLGFAGNTLSYSIPYAEWTLQPAPCPPTCVGGTYSLFDTRTESHFVYSVGLYPSLDVGPDGRYGHVVALLSMTNGFRNQGFTNTPSNGSTVSSTDPIVLLGAGYGIRYEGLHASALLYRPLTDASSPVDYGVGFQVTLGVDLETIRTRDDPADGRPD
jgi:hypothetical protein